MYRDIPMKVCSIEQDGGYEKEQSEFVDGFLVPLNLKLRLLKHKLRGGKEVFSHSDRHPNHQRAALQESVLRVAQHALLLPMLLWIEHKGRDV
jgi:hypothetical protein